MEKYFKRKLPPNFEENGDVSRQKNLQIVLPELSVDPGLQKKLQIGFPELPIDPGLRPRISDYSCNIRDEVRKAYLLRGPCQPRGHDFPFKKFGQVSRRFVPAWFDEYPNWLEYSVAKDAAFCLCCYLFRPQVGEQGGGDCFIGRGFSNWKKKERFKTHVGGPNSAHNVAWGNCEALMKQNKHILTCFSKPSLNALIDCLRFILRQGLAFYDNDGYEDLSNQGNFVELLRFLANYNEDIKVIALKNTPESLKLRSPEIQKDIVSAASIETINVIVQDIGDSLFSILIDEALDASMEKHMVVIFRHVDKKGQVIERFVGLEHVTSTCSSLKIVIDKLFSRLGLSLSRLRGQGYNGTSNMMGKFNLLKSLILKENECAYSIHCFAHQLHLSIVALAKNHIEVQSLFHVVANVVNIVGALRKNFDLPHEKLALIVVEEFNSDKLSSGNCLNQETTLERFRDTSWGSYYDTLMYIITMFSSIIDTVELIADDGSISEQKCEANNLLEMMQSFNFVFSLHLMKDILGLTSELSQVLQRGDQDIVNAMKLVGLCKQRLQMMREGGWDSFLCQVSSFCVKHNIDVPYMDDMFLPLGQPRRKAQEITNLHHYRVELYYAILDMQLQELNSSFNEVNIELLLCFACLCPNDSFAAFDKQKLIRLAEFYPKDFSATKLMALEIQLEVYIMDMRSSIEFLELEGIGDLAKKLVETKKHNVYTLVYSLISLALILPVVTATVKRAFSTTNFVKTQLRNRTMDQWMNDNLVVYIENNVFKSIENEAIIQRIESMKMR
ncbi:uncharacterized protein LOC116113999 [Pistacia vera]|uniref:uncharacterized protein LOC116113999 n=1 Tax=Pistacia vera TaxID=55513 RepID=UPI0012635913|nr:uncharacterized protein LOC116113999 [Pistacia vera]